MPAIDPFSLINQEISRSESGQRLERYGIPRDLPLVVQAGRFDKWKDPQGVIDAFCLASQETPATLVLAGKTAADDSEGPAMYERICHSSGERIIIIAADDPLLVNALQRRAAVVLHSALKSRTTLSAPIPARASHAHGAPFAFRSVVLKRPMVMFPTH